VLASLNHPNIAHIHGIEESAGVTALVMELVEGEAYSFRFLALSVSIQASPVCCSVDAGLH